MLIEGELLGCLTGDIPEVACTDAGEGDAVVGGELADEFHLGDWDVYTRIGEAGEETLYETLEEEALEVGRERSVRVERCFLLHILLFFILRVKGGRRHG